MTQTVAVILLLIMYVGLPALVLFALYRIYKIVKQGRGVVFDAIPDLKTVTTKNLSPELVNKITAIDQKAKKLLGYYDSKQIKDEAIMGESQFLVKKILSTDLPESVQSFQRLDNVRANQMAVGTTGKTAKILFNEYLDTINKQFDEMLDAMYEQNAQKLLVSNRYLQTRFDNASDGLNISTLTNTAPNQHTIPQLAQPQATGIEIQPPSIKVPETVTVKIDP